MINIKKSISLKLGNKEHITKVGWRYKCTNLDKYQLIQRSIVPTLHFQKSLPRLPIPKLEDTVERYLKSLKPIVGDESYLRTEKNVHSFLSNEGPLLQEELVQLDKQNKHTSYISKLWFDMYLADRTPLPINYNPCLVFTNYNHGFYDQQLPKITNMVISSLRFYQSLRHNTLEPEVFHLNPKKTKNQLFNKFTSMLPSAISWYGAYLFNAYPLDMSQYTSLFCNTRIPEKDKDRLYHAENSKHIVVLRNGNFYIVEVLNEKDEIIAPHIIHSSFEFILNDKTEPSDCPIGILTSTERNNWAEIRQHLVNIGNEEALKKIDSALFAVALDNIVVQSNEDVVRWFLHSDGKNRWFDKSFTLICTTNGFAGLNFEHSWGDGVAVLRYFSDIFEDSRKNPEFTQSMDTLPLLESELPKRLNFNIDDKIRSSVSEAQKKFDNICKNLTVSAVIQNLGRFDCKTMKISPDAVMQLIFQLANYDLNKTFVPTYESCSTAAFKHGRTETVRPCTLQTAEFCKYATSSQPDKSILRDMIKNCSKVHTELVKNAAMGKGFDRHLFALRKLAETNGQLPSVFEDPNYNYINYNILSTSTLSSELVLAGGFGPVVEDGYGIAYMIRENTCGTVVTNYRNRTSGKKFADSLVKSVEIVKNILR